MYIWVGTIFLLRGYVVCVCVYMQACTHMHVLEEGMVLGREEETWGRENWEELE